MERQIMGIFFSLLKRFRRSRSPRPPTSRRLVLEQLEDRLCPSSTVIDLGTLGATYTSSSASAVNASGQVVGTSATAVSGFNHAFLWHNGVMTDLGILPNAARSVAGDINDSGQIVGGSSGTVNNTSWSHAVLWQNGIMTDLGTLGGESSGAGAINNSGQIVGYSKTAAGDFGSFVWENGVMYDLNALLPASSGWVTQALNGIDINDNRQIAGTGLFNGLQRAFLITDNDGTFANGGLTITNLGTLAGGYSSAADMNNLGQVVGSSYAGAAYAGNSHAVRYSGGVVTDLKSLVGNPTIGDNSSNANAINDAGQIVGSSSTTTWNVRHAVLWQNGKMTDLNKQLPRGSAWVLESASDINEAGQIVGQGSTGGQRHAFLMVPGAPLQAQSVSTEAVTQTIGMDEVQSLLGEAIARWQAAGADSSSLSGVEVRIADLSGTTLGFASGNTIWIDSNAAGWGWFVDSTPGDDSEFTTDGDQGEQGRIDLLTVLMHEIGHLLGHEHETDGVMTETLTAGTRSSPISDADAADSLLSLYSIDVGSTAAWLEARDRNRIR
jgi:probable HAF family extracellular repeat protein